MSNFGQTLNEKYGVGLGATSGIYSWPYASCVGKVTEKGRYVRTTNEEALKICLAFCKASGSGDVCKKNCQKIYDSYKNSKETYSHETLSSGQGKSDHTQLIEWAIVVFFTFCFLMFVILKFFLRKSLLKSALFSFSTGLFFTGLYALVSSILGQ